jgi:hypothetical protein
MGSIPGSDENVMSEHLQKYKKDKCLRSSKPFTYFEGFGTYDSQYDVPEINKKIIFCPFHRRFFKIFIGKLAIV